MYPSRTTVAAFAVFCILVMPGGAQQARPIYVQYDGFVRNPDNTLTLVFGYFNTNYADVTIQPGDGNRFLPAPTDRNQPITFLKGRHRFACVMVVPATFDGDIRWQVTFGGTDSVTTAKVLDRLYELEEASAQRAVSGVAAAGFNAVCLNRPPTIRIVADSINRVRDPDSPVAASFNTRVNEVLTLATEVDDDGLPRNGKVTVSWRKTSGPGEVALTRDSDASTRASFGAPGVYELEVSATDTERSRAVKVKVNVDTPSR